MTFWLREAGPAIRVTALVSAAWLRRVAVNRPAASVMPAFGLRALLRPVAAKVTDWLATGLPKASLMPAARAMTLVLSATCVLGVSVSDDTLAFGLPATKASATVPLALPAAYETVFPSARVEETFEENWPLWLVLPLAGARTTLLPAADRATGWLATGLP